MENITEHYNIVDFITEQETGIVVDSLDEAHAVIFNLEKKTTNRYIPLLIKETDETNEEIY